LEKQLKILFLGKNYSQGLKDSDPSSIASIASKSGHQILRDVDEGPDIVVCVDYKRSDMKIVRRAKLNNVPCVLMVNEPKVVIPQNSNEGTLRMFDRIVRIGRPDSLPMVRWAQTWRELNSNLSRMEKVVLVNADKWSFVPGQLYWLRAALAVKHDSIDVFGPGWDRSFLVRFSHRVFEFMRTLAAKQRPSLSGSSYVLAKPLSYKGTVADKVRQMANYKISLVIENSQELLTEKLFDAWFAGCIPVYVGPDLEKFGLPEDLVITCDPSVTSVQRAVERAYAVDLAEFHKKLDLFLNSPEAAGWRSDWAIHAALEAALESKTSS
jgi:hypothetical protein